MTEEVKTDFKYNQYLHTVECPIETLNLLGGGGLRFGTLIEGAGPPSGGKSTFFYQTARNFQRQYPFGILQICDAENSVDDLRLTKAFGIDINSPNYRINYTPSIESMYANVSTCLAECTKKNIPYFGIIDSWTALNIDKDIAVNAEQIEKKGTDAEITRFASGMMQKAQIGRYWLNMLMMQMYRKPYILTMINQATTEVGRFQSKVTSGGGYGFKHNIQFSLWFEKKAKELNGEGVGAVIDGSKSLVWVEKSKFMPQLDEIPMYINTKKGGIIESHRELVEVAVAKGCLHKSGAWNQINEGDKSVRWEELYADEYQAEIKKKMIAKFRSEYMLVDALYEEIDRLKTAEAQSKVLSSTT